MKVDGSGRITLKNCCLVRKMEFQAMLTPILSALPEPTGTAIDIPVMHPDFPMSASNDTHAAVGYRHEAFTHHHALGTHSACHQKFLTDHW